MSATTACTRSGCSVPTAIPRIRSSSGPADYRVRWPVGCISTAGGRGWWRWASRRPVLSPLRGYGAPRSRPANLTPVRHRKNLQVTPSWCHHGVMDLQPYVDAVRHELKSVASAGGETAVDLADRLSAPLESALRLALLEALSAAAEEITGELAPGSVEVR